MDDIIPLRQLGAILIEHRPVEAPMYVPVIDAGLTAIGYCPNGDDWFLHVAPGAVLVGDETRFDYEIDPWQQPANDP